MSRVQRHDIQNTEQYLRFFNDTAMRAYWCRSVWTISMMQQ